jgi:lysophospholipase L1-like esterase
MQRWCLALGLLCGAAASQAKDTAHWVTSWMQPMTAQVVNQRGQDGKLARDAGGDPIQQRPSVQDITLRQRVRLSLGGTQLRIRISNVFGRQPLDVGAAQLALAAQDSTIRPGTSVPITFNRRSQAQVPAGEELLSDPLDLDAPALSMLSVSLYLPGKVELADMHPLQQGRVSWAVSGNAVAAKTLEGRTPVSGLSPERGDHIYALTSVEVSAKPGTRTVIAFGDSITDGYGASTPWQSWPAALATLANAAGARGLAVGNAGISADEMAADQLEQPGAGIAGLKRYYRDVIDRAGVTDVVVLFGANDINRGPDTALSPTGAHARELMASYRMLADVAHQHGLRIWAGTVLPFSDDDSWYSPQRDATRRAVNAWLSSTKLFDGVIDFADAVEGPYDTRQPPPGAPVPQGIATVCVVDEGVHPNDRGYAAMAQAAFNALSGAKGKVAAPCRETAAPANP